MELSDSDLRVSISRRTSTISKCSEFQLAGNSGICLPSSSPNSKNIAEIQSSNCIIIPIAPFWTIQPWFPDLAQLLIDYSVKLPILQNLISLQRGKFHHPNVEMLKLTAWKLSTNSTLRKGFSRSVSKRAASCIRNSTNKTYNYRLRLYFDWAKEQHVNPLLASEL